MLLFLFVDPLTLIVQKTIPLLAREMTSSQRATNHFEAARR